MMSVFVEISLILVLSVAISGVIRYFKQPMIIGYILTGLIAGPYVFNILNSQDILNIFSTFGIALLLFIVGMHLNPGVIREVGKVSILGGTLAVIFSILFVFLLTLILGFTTVEALYLGVGLSFSSTIIVMKLLNDKGDLEKLYAKITIGFLLVQDIIAMVALIIISISATGGSLANVLFQTVVKALFLILFLYASYKYLLPQIFKFAAKSQEFLFLFALAWGMGLASLFEIMGFSIEIGALVAGVMLALFPYHHEVSSKLRPLRDFFIILFFISLGANIMLGDLLGILFSAVLLTIFTLFIKPIIFMGILGYFGYTKRNSFMVAISMAQISEFSLVLVEVGKGAGQIGNNITTLITVVGIITITVSSYFVLYSDKIYNRIEKYLSIFERKDIKEVDVDPEHYDIVLFGANRIGHSFIRVFKKAKAKFLVVDFNPQIIEQLKKENIDCIYGDAEDTEFLDDLNLYTSKMVISTIPDIEANKYIVKKVEHKNSDVVTLAVSHTIAGAYELYKAGVDYVIMPHFLGGKYASTLVHRYGFDKTKFELEKQMHLESLKERESKGHDHPIY